MARPWVGKSRRRIRIKNHAFLPDGVYTLARVIVAERLGRPLSRFELVHHRDHDETNDHPSNLVLITSKDHSAIHLKGKHRSEETKRRISRTQVGDRLSKINPRDTQPWLKLGIHRNTWYKWKRRNTE